MANAHLGSCHVKRCQERWTAESGELMVLIIPYADPLLVWRQFTESGCTDAETYCSVFRRDRGRWPAL